MQLASGHNIESTSSAGEQSQNRKIRVGLNGVANRVRNISKRSIDSAVGAKDTGTAVGIGGSSVLFGDPRNRNTLTGQGAIPVRVMRRVYSGVRGEVFRCFCFFQF